MAIQIQSPKESKQDLINKVREREFLAIREKFKEEIRRKMRTESVSAVSSANVSSEENKNFPYNDFGSFFGPSEPCIARRMIDKTQNSPKIQRLASVDMKVVRNKPKSSVSLQEKKKKKETLRYARDYSFLNSSDFDLSTFAAKPSSQGLESLKLQESKARLQTNSVLKESIRVSSDTKTRAKQDMSKKREVKNELVAKRRHEQEDVLESKKKAKLMSDNHRHSKDMQEQQQQQQQRCPYQSLAKEEEKKKKKVLETKDEKIEPKKKVLEPSNSGKKPEEDRVVKPKSSLQHKNTRPRGVCTCDESLGADFDSILQMLSRGNRGRQNKQSDYGGDDDCMVSSFSDIEKEERRSARIARKEDEIERLKVEKEEQLRRQKAQQMKRREEKQS